MTRSFLVYVAALKSTKMMKNIAATENRPFSVSEL
jgi:hypothetical protein